MSAPLVSKCTNVCAYIFLICMFVMFGVRIKTTKKELLIIFTVPYVVLCHGNAYCHTVGLLNSACSSI